MIATIETKTQRRRRAYKRNKKMHKALQLNVVPGALLANGLVPTYYAHGINSSHFIFLKATGEIVCDCGNGSSPCSHVIAVRMHRGEWK